MVNAKATKKKERMKSEEGRRRRRRRLRGKGKETGARSGPKEEMTVPEGTNITSCLAP